MKRILLLAASILLALAAQDNLQRRAMVADAVLLYAAAAVAFVWAMADSSAGWKVRQIPRPPRRRRL